MASQNTRLHDLHASCDQALARSAWFEAERLACQGLAMARQEHAFERMAALCAPLAAARQGRLQMALAVKRVTVVDAPIVEPVKPSRGCLLVVPPNVGADARRLRLAALSAEIAAAVLCCEPLTSLKLAPVVAISPGATIRTKLPSPRDPARPAVQWFIEAMMALGDWALQSIDSDLPPIRRVDALMDRLEAIPEHAGLHEALAEACLAAQQEQQAAAKSPRAARGPRAPISAP